MPPSSSPSGDLQDYQVGDTLYKFPSSMNSEEVKQALSSKGIIKLSNVPGAERTGLPGPGNPKPSPEGAEKAVKTQAQLSHDIPFKGPPGQPLHVPGTSDVAGAASMMATGVTAPGLGSALVAAPATTILRTVVGLGTFEATKAASQKWLHTNETVGNILGVVGATLAEHGLPSEQLLRDLWKFRGDPEVAKAAFKFFSNVKSRVPVFGKALNKENLEGLEGALQKAKASPKPEVTPFPKGKGTGTKFTPGQEVEDLQVGKSLPKARKVLGPPKGSEGEVEEVAEGSSPYSQGASKRASEIAKSWEKKVKEGAKTLKGAGVSSAKMKIASPEEQARILKQLGHRTMEKSATWAHLVREVEALEGK